MKTIKQLRDAIKEADGDLKIGAVSFSCENEEADVDVHFEGLGLAFYFSSKLDGDSSLSDAENYSIMSDFTKDGRETKKKRAASIEELESKVAEAGIALGKVEAYEKLLIGRTVNLGQ